MTHNSDPTIQSDLAVLSEGRRFPEVKVARNALIDNVNEFLDELGARRDDPAWKGRVALQHTDVIRQIPLTPNHIAEESKCSISLTGGGKEQPWNLQAVMPSAWAGSEEPGVRTILMTGTHPFARMYGHDYDEDRRGETIIDFSVEDDHGGVVARSGYKVRGSGGLEHKFINDRGSLVNRPVRDLAGAQAAQAAFNAVRTEIGQLLEG